MALAPRLDFNAAILVGGYSRRFGSDKALADFGNGVSYNYLARKLARLQPQRLLLSGRAEQQKLFSGYEFIADELARGGPFAGLLSVLRRYQDLPVLLVACDYPDIETALLQQLMELFEPEQCDAAAPRQGADSNFYEPTLALYAPSCLSVMEQMLSTDAPCSLQRLLRLVRVRALENQILPKDIDYKSI